MKKRRYSGKRKKAAAALLGAALAMTGCGGVGENTALGMEALQTLDYQGAIESFDTARAMGEGSKQLARAEGIAYLGLTQYGQAADCFLEALGYSDGWVEDMDYDINFYLAAAYTKDNRLSEAEEVYSAILAMQPKNEDALFLRGNARMGLDNYAGAKEDFDQVIAMDGKNFDRLIQIYEVLYNYGYKEAGQTYLRTAMENYEAQMSDYDKGRMYYYLEEYQSAYLALETAKDQGGAEAYLYLGKSYEATGDYNYAVSVYNNYLAKDTSDARIYNQLGLCEMALGDYDAALSAFQAGMQIEGNDVMQSLLFNEAVTYEYLHDYQQAAALMENYLKTYPDDQVAKREYDFLSTR
ncbi:MAG: tetratricopeptide repeat protein [Lachnospiraceae bacterium]|nr:tetratricopeptide repeat protein [Lachnospiraceae bacterium]